MPTISEPQTEARDNEYKRSRDLFLVGRMGENTLRVTLKLLGRPPIDIDAELYLAKLDRDDPKQVYAARKRL